MIPVPWSSRDLPAVDGGIDVASPPAPDEDLRVLIRDDGGGLAADRRTGVGLFSMRERAAELGGTCTVTSDASGTLVDARLPVGYMTSGG